FLPREFDQRVGDLRAAQLDDLRAELLGEADVVLHRLLVVGVAGPSVMSFHSDSEPLRVAPPGQPRADAQETLGFRVAAERHQYFRRGLAARERVAFAVLLA